MFRALLRICRARWTIPLSRIALTAIDKIKEYLKRAPQADPHGAPHRTGDVAPFFHGHGNSRPGASLPLFDAPPLDPAVLG